MRQLVWVAPCTSLTNGTLKLLSELNDQGFSVPTFQSIHHVSNTAVSRSGVQQIQFPLDGFMLKISLDVSGVLSRGLCP